MTFIISPKGVQNTEGTTAKFGSGGSVLVGGNFKNSGNVEVDIRANLTVLGDIINSGRFNIQDYINENNYRLIENAITDLEGDPKNYLETVYQSLKVNNIPEANSYFNRFVSYIKNHPELITGSIQVLLQIFGLNIEKK